MRPGVILETPRLRLRLPETGDAPFFLELLNDPDWHRFVNDPGVRDLAAAEAWIEARLLDLYRRCGFTLYLVECKEDERPLGICGLVKRDSLEHVDLGFGFLPEFRCGGYAKEASLACMRHAKEDFGLETLLAVTDHDNEAAGGLLTALGFLHEGDVQLEDGKTLRLFVTRP